MKITPRTKLVHAGTRIPPSVRELAIKMAKEKKVSEATIYREIIVHFFSPDSTQNVEESSTISEECEPA